MAEFTETLATHRSLQQFSSLCKILSNFPTLPSLKSSPLYLIKTIACIDTDMKRDDVSVHNSRDILNINLKLSLTSPS